MCPRENDKKKNGKVKNKKRRRVRESEDAKSNVWTPSSLAGEWTDDGWDAADGNQLVVLASLEPPLDARAYAVPVYTHSKTRACVYTLEYECVRVCSVTTPAKYNNNRRANYTRVYTLVYDGGKNTRLQALN